MAAHDDDNPPPEEFQKLAKMTEKKWNVYRRPITLVLNVGLFVSTIVISRKKYFLTNVLPPFHFFLTLVWIIF